MNLDTSILALKSCDPTLIPLPVPSESITNENISGQKLENRSSSEINNKNETQKGRMNLIKIIIIIYLYLLILSKISRNP